MKGSNACQKDPKGVLLTEQIVSLIPCRRRMIDVEDVVHHCGTNPRPSYFHLYLPRICVGACSLADSAGLGHFVCRDPFNPCFALFATSEKCPCISASGMHQHLGMLHLRSLPLSSIHIMGCQLSQSLQERAGIEVPVWAVVKMSDSAVELGS